MGGEEKGRGARVSNVYYTIGDVFFVSRIFDAHTPYNCMLLRPGCRASSLSSKGLGA
jgi:hypothetical protein